MVKYTKKIIIDKFRKTHGNKYDYSIIDYKNTYTKVDIICFKHGVFKQTPKHHYSGNGCSSCSGHKNLTTKDFIERSKLVHGNKYDYSLVEYINGKTKVRLICSEHGEFDKNPRDHMYGSGCRGCLSYSLSEFIKLSFNIHGNKYDYSLVKIKNNKTNVKIICPKHGKFEQQPNNHIKNKQGCPICNESKGERVIRDYLIKNNINYITQYKFKKCKDIKLLLFDFYLPDYNICIEFNGLQHYKSVKFFGGDTALKIRQKRDKIKETYCDENNIRLIIIKYNDNPIKKLKNFRIFL